MYCQDGLSRTEEYYDQRSKKKDERQENGKQTFVWKWTPCSNF